MQLDLFTLYHSTDWVVSKVELVGEAGRNQVVLIQPPLRVALMAIVVIIESHIPSILRTDTALVFPLYLDSFRSAKMKDSVKFTMGEIYTVKCIWLPNVIIW